ncbi:hypothetical protein CV093_05035 [Oceanobacillus sp. 143]|nr:hypothetical protein CV093_05035 [Oceanobacillus sp. 143]
MNQAKTAAKNMFNPKTERYNTIPYFWSDQYDVRFQYLGHAKDWDSTVLRGSIEEKNSPSFI